MDEPDHSGDASGSDTMSSSSDSWPPPQPMQQPAWDATKPTRRAEPLGQAAKRPTATENDEEEHAKSKPKLGNECSPEPKQRTHQKHQAQETIQFLGCFGHPKPD